MTIVFPEYLFERFVFEYLFKSYFVDCDEQSLYDAFKRVITWGEFNRNRFDKL